MVSLYIKYEHTEGMVGQYGVGGTLQILVKDPNALHNRMEVARAVKGRKLVVEPITEESHPKWFVENIERFRHLITED